MSIATVSSKGQITLPAKMRRRLGVNPHSRISIEQRGLEIVIKPLPRLLDLEGFLGKTVPNEHETMMDGVADHVLGRNQ